MSNELTSEELRTYRLALEDFKAPAFTSLPVPSPEKKMKIEGADEEEYYRFKDQRLEEMLESVARRGKTEIEWELLKPAIVWRLEAVGRHMLSVAQVHPDRLPPKNLQHTEGPEFLQRLIVSARSLNGAPFTIQRLAELLTKPRHHYARWDKFFRALEKTLTVVTTVCPMGYKESARPAQTPNSSAGDSDQTPRFTSSESVSSGPNNVSPSSSSDQTVILGPSRSSSAILTPKDETGELPTIDKTEDRMEESEMMSPRPNVRISVEPVRGGMEEKNENEEIPTPPQHSVEISVEVEDCGEVKEASALPATNQPSS